MKNMKLFTRSEKDPMRLNASSMILPIVFCLVCGVLLIAFGDLALKITAYVLAGVLILWGIFQIIAYLRSQPIVRITESKLATGLILLVTGILLVFNPDYLKGILQYVWGLALLFGGFLKIQYAFDEKTVKVRKWWMMLIFAAFSLIVGIIAMLDPAFLGENRNLVIGILLVVEAVLDITVYFLLNHALKKLSTPAEASAEEPAPAGPSPAQEHVSAGQPSPEAEPENE